MYKLPPTAPHSLLTRSRKKTPISVRFYLRPNKSASTPDQIILVRITIKGDEDAGFSSLPESEAGHILACPTRFWNQKFQRRIDRSQEAITLNSLLDRIQSRIRDIYERQRNCGITPSRETVKKEYLWGKPIEQLQTVNGQYKRLTLYTAYQEYVLYLYSMRSTEVGLQLATLRKWDFGLVHLKSFLTATKQLDLAADNVTAGWDMRFHSYLMSANHVSATTAARYVNQVRDAFSYLVQTDRLKHNPLFGLKLPKSKDKDVYFLEPVHLERFWNLKLTGTAYDVWWWTGLMILTGLDYVDAKRYYANRSKYEVADSFGRKIVICRDKTDQECHIPIDDELSRLLTRQPNITPVLKTINDMLLAIELMIGFPNRFTTKIARKTAAMRFLTTYSIKAVSRILGHSTINMTEKHYAKVTGNDVDRERAQQAGSPFKDISKAA